MRVYKFRAWDKEEKRMIDWKYLLDYCDIDYLFGNQCLEEKRDTVQDFEIMQYTGLNDKNGTEIYEGDIVKFVDVGEEGYEYKEGFDFTNYASIEFDNGRWELNNFIDNNSGMLETMNSCHEDFINEFELFEVIGNIYENQELLEGRE